jgi:hypothetical protein
MLGTMAGGALMGAGTKAFGIWMQYKQENHKVMMELLAGREESIKSAREYDTPSAGWGRRFITMMSFCLLAFLVMAPALDPTLVTNVPVEHWLPWMDTTYTELKGLIAYDVLMEILVATTSFYMGSATIGNRYR